MIEERAADAFSAAGRRWPAHVIRVLWVRSDGVRLRAKAKAKAKATAKRNGMDTLRIRSNIYQYYF